MAKYTGDFKRQIAAEIAQGGHIREIAKRHGIARNSIRLWVEQLEAGVFDEDECRQEAIDDLRAKVAAFERLAGRQALEIEFLKGAANERHATRSAPPSVIAGPTVSPSPKDADS